MAFLAETLVVFLNLVSISKTVNIEGKYTKNVTKADVVYPLRVSIDGHSIEGGKLEQRFNRSTIYEEPTIYYRITHGTNQFILELRGNTEIYSPDAILELRVGDTSLPDQLSNIRSRLISDEQCTYTGKVRGQEDSSAALSTCNGLSGYIRIRRKLFFIEPINHKENSEEKGHILYENYRTPQLNAKINREAALTEQLDVKKHYKKESLTKEIKDSKKEKPLKLEVLLVADKSMIDSHSSNDIENYVLAILNMAQSVYNDLFEETPTDFQLVRLLELHDINDEMNLVKDDYATQILKSFSEWQHLINPKSDSHPNHHDIAVLLTRKQLCNENNKCHFLGISEMGGVCREKRDAAVCKDNGLFLGYTLARAIAINIGMNDTAYELSSNPIRDNSDIGSFLTTKSIKQRQDIHDSTRNGLLSCLYDVPISEHSTYSDILPGIVYGADYQCARLYDPQAKHCTNLNENGFAVDCHSLKCMYEGTSCSNTGVMAAPGTPCSKGKWCYDGECTKAGERPEPINGGWSIWSDWSSCTRSCGSGVSVSERDCIEPKPMNGGKACSGARKRHRICSVEPCPAGSNTYRDIQCAMYNDWIFPGDKQLHNWTGFLISNGNPCVLTCINENKQVLTLQKKVKDGTSCYRGLRDICVDGLCKTVGCDFKLDTKSVEDGCGVCHGNGTECDIIQGSKAVNGVTEVTLLPAGSRNIKVEGRVMNLFVKTMDNKQQLNMGGSLGIFNVPGSVGWCGLKEGKSQIIEIPGPIVQPIHIWATADKPEVVSYIMSLPAANREGRYSWQYMDWSPCKAQCGLGTQDITPRCIEAMSGLVEDKYCNHLVKPVIKKRNCTLGPCLPRWFVGDWKACGPCPSSKAKRFRKVYCIKPLSGEEDGIAIEQTKECSGERPAAHEHCKCLKRNVNYWPPHCTKNNLLNILLKSHTIRKIRSTKTPDKQLTLMQLENENEESMMRQFQENQHHQNPFNIIPNIFGYKLNFSLPLKKREFSKKQYSLKKRNLANRHNSNMRDQSCACRVNELEQYFEKLISEDSPDSKGLKNGIYIDFPPSDKLIVNLRNIYGDLNNLVGSDSIKEDNLLTIKKHFQPIVQSPNNFSDQRVLKILLNNLALDKLQQNKYQFPKIQKYVELPFEKNIIQNKGGSEDLDFLGDISGQLYKVLKMQSYLQNLLNSSQYDNFSYSYKTMSDKGHLSDSDILQNYIFKNCYMNKLPNLKRKKENLNYSNTSNIKASEPQEKRESKMLSNLSDKTSTASYKPYQKNSLKSNQTIQNDNFLGQSIIRFENNVQEESPNVKDLLISPSRQLEKEMVALNTSFHGKYMEEEPSDSNLFLKPSNTLPDVAMEDKQFFHLISNRIQKLSAKERVRLYKVLDNLLDYLNRVHPLGTINNDLVKMSNGNVNPFSQHYFNKKILAKDEERMKSFTDDLSVPINMSNLTNQLDIVQNYPQNTLFDELKMLLHKTSNINNLNELKVHSPIDSPLIMKRCINPEQQLVSSENFKFNVKQNHNFLTGNVPDDHAEIVGPLKFIYTIPEGRKCNKSTTTVANKYPCILPGKLKRSFSNKLQRDSTYNSADISPKIDTLRNKGIIPQRAQQIHLDSNKKQSNFNKLNSKRDSEDQSIKNPKLKTYNKCSQKQFIGLSTPGCPIHLNEACKASSCFGNKKSCKNDVFYFPPGYNDYSLVNTHFKCLSNVIIELQKELQLMRNRQCTGCYYLYKDHTIPTKKPNKE